MILFSKLRNKIKFFVNKNNIVEWMEICLKIQIIHAEIWSLFVQLLLKNFQEFDVNKQSKAIKMIDQYINGKFMKFLETPSKFLYR